MNGSQNYDHEWRKSDPKKYKGFHFYEVLESVKLSIKSSNSHCHRQWGWRLTGRGSKDTLWDDGDIPYHDSTVCYQGICICQSSSNYKYKIYTFHCTISLYIKYISICSK